MAGEIASNEQKQRADALVEEIREIPKPPVTVREIVADWLRSNGFAGLYDPHDPCGCSADDLAPCSIGEIPELCAPAYTTPDCAAVGCELECTAHGLKHFGPKP